MAASTTNRVNIPAADLASFTIHLQSSRRILALLGAGLSASSGLPTFRGAGGLWRTHDATSLATPEAFQRDPGLVWQFYSYRRHMALNAAPNAAHHALSALAQAKRPEEFMTLSQNVDGLSPRAGHGTEQGLRLLHGSLFDVKCWDEDGCGYVRRNDFTDPIVESLRIPIAEEQEVSAGIRARADERARENLEAAIVKKHAVISGEPGESSENQQAEGAAYQTSEDRLLHPKSSIPPTAAKKHLLIRGADIADASITIPKLHLHDLPHCPQCQKALLRPGVVWFGESLPTDVLEDVNAWVDAPERIDLMLVIGTSSVVYPAAGYTHIAREKGARVAVINLDRGDARGLTKSDWFFQGDAAVILPEILKGVVGEVGKL